MAMNRGLEHNRDKMTNKGLTVKRWLRAGVLVMFASAFLWRCANISSPQGGPKDSLPPIIVSATPGFGTTNFTGKEIYIGFNEYVQIKDQQKEFFTRSEEHTSELQSR